MKYLILTFIGVYLSINLSAQKTFDLITLSGRNGFPQTYNSDYNGKANEKGVMVNVAVPIKLSEKTMWYSSVNYFYWNVTNDETMPADILNPINIHGIIFRTGFIQKFSNDREIQVLAVPRLMSDLNNVNIDHFQFGGIVMFKKKYSGKLTMSYGAMYNQECQNQLVGPNYLNLLNIVPIPI